MSESTALGTKGYIHFPLASYLSASYQGPVTVVEARDNLIWVTLDDDPDAEAHLVYETTRALVSAPAQHLILEGEDGFDKAAAWVKYDALRAKTAAVVRKWCYDEANPGKALQASEALRVLASTPAPEGY